MISSSRIKVFDGFCIMLDGYCDAPKRNTLLVFYDKERADTSAVRFQGIDLGFGDEIYDVYGEDLAARVVNKEHRAQPSFELSPIKASACTLRDEIEGCECSSSRKPSKTIRAHTQVPRTDIKHAAAFLCLKRKSQ